MSGQKLNSEFSPHRLQKKKGSCLYQSVIDVDAEERVDNRKESGDHQDREPPNTDIKGVGYPTIPPRLFLQNDFPFRVTPNSAKEKFWRKEECARQCFYILFVFPSKTLPLPLPLTPTLGANASKARFLWRQSHNGSQDLGVSAEPGSHTSATNLPSSVTSFPEICLPSTNQSF